MVWKSQISSYFTNLFLSTAVKGTNDFFDVSGHQTKQPAFTTVTFSRKLVTEDVNDHPITNAVTRYGNIPFNYVVYVELNPLIRFVWAHGNVDNKDRNPNEFKFHGDKYRGAFEANLFLSPDAQQIQPPTADISQLIVDWHGSLMVSVYKHVPNNL